MKSLLRLLALPVAFAATLATSRAQNSTPYLETASLTVLWNFTITGLSGTTLGPVPIVPGAGGPVDPDQLRPVDRVTTEKGTPITYSVSTGDQAFFVDKTITNLINGFQRQKEDLQAQADELEAGPEKDALIAQIAALDAEIKFLKDRRGGRWELTAVRAPQSTVEGAATTPFQVFLTAIDPVTIGRPAPTYLTDMRLVPVAYAGTFKENRTDGVVSKAGGKVTIHFEMEFENYSEDGKEHWIIFGTGYINGTIRSTPGPLAAVALSKSSVTGHGTWTHETGSGNYYSGIAPLAIKLGETKYQNRNLFPGFVSP